MIDKEFPFLELFQQFIKESYNGKRRKPNGDRIKSQTVDNYVSALKLLKEFSEKTSFYLRIKVHKHQNIKQLNVDRNYWKRFYRSFSDFLYRKSCFDNYIGCVMKIIR